MIEGKTKTLTEYNGNLKITTKNVLTANDAAKQEQLDLAEYKTSQTCAVFELLKKHKIATHYIDRLDSTSFLVEKCEMIPLECVVRGKATGSFLKRYPHHTDGDILKPLRYETFHKLAYNVEEDKLMNESEAREQFMVNGKWHRPIITDPYCVFNWGDWRHRKLTPNANQGFNIQLYDPKKPLNIHDILYKKEADISVREYELIRDTCINVYILLQKAWLQFNIDLVDFKLEFGRHNKTKELLLADVIDNDSWRLWPAGNRKEQLDKQSFRDGSRNDLVTENYKKVTEYTDKFPYLEIEQ